MRRCDFGGVYHYVDDKPVYQDRCHEAPTVRYRGPGFVAGHWGHRCTKHAAILDRSRVTVEPLGGAE